jgi:Immunoglobulin domain
LPQISPFSFGEDEVNFDDTVSVMCTITKGDSQGLKIYWQFQGDEDLYPFNLTTNDGIVISRNNQKISMLAIEAVKARHRGNYTCYAQNRAGVTQHSAFLAVNGSNYFLFDFNYPSSNYDSEFCNLRSKHHFSLFSSSFD